MKRVGPRLAIEVSRFLYKIFLRWSVIGRENVPLTGPLVVIANHVNSADPVMLMCAFPRWVTYMAKEELFHNPLFGAFLRSGGVFPVSRTGSVENRRNAIRQAETLLSEGHALGVFPEGTRDRTGVLLQGRPGAVSMAIHTGAPIIPVAFAGTEQIGTRWWILRRPKVTVTIGTPFHLTSTSSTLSRSQSASLTEEMMRHLAALLPPDKRGPYGDM
ncbi:MAG: 1-acyl-sn-glycerol-3-phosphate acyltransferase [Dehalococcoidia bacterium]|nr:1-acyl-sn-glycerol-3-phosphate acyltransferase [Dehalococcoidia bacterium]